jgi:hypothetical protein
MFGLRAPSKTFDLNELTYNHRIKFNGMQTNADERDLLAQREGTADSHATT